MKVRILSSIVGIALLISVVLLGEIALGAAVFIIALIGMHEFYSSLEHAGYKPIKTAGYISCLPILLIGFGEKLLKGSILEQLGFLNCAAFILFVMMATILLFAIFYHDKYNMNDLSLTVFGILYVAFMFTFLVLTRTMEHGSYYIWLVFIGAWATDTFAYFIGSTIGKTKFLPTISSKKSLEGSIGGLAGCIVITTVYGAFITGSVGDLPLYHFILIGLLCGIISQLGDWAASAIKRYVGVKDFGRLMPGHGGVLDRFDSILFIAPVIYFYVTFIVK